MSILHTTFFRLKTEIVLCVCGGVFLFLFVLFCFFAINNVYFVYLSEITAANHASVCTYAVFGEEPTQQPVSTQEVLTNCLAG